MGVDLLAMASVLDNLRVALLAEISREQAGKALGWEQGAGLAQGLAKLVAFQVDLVHQLRELESEKVTPTGWGSGLVARS